MQMNIFIGNRRLILRSTMKLELKFVPSLSFPVIFYFAYYILFSAHVMNI